MVGARLRMSPGGLDLAPVKDLLLRVCGHRFGKEREPALAAALGRRMAALQITAGEAYQQRLNVDRQELLCLAELLTVNETYFFREPEHLRLVVDTLLPARLEEGRPGPIRILSAGCSTGEEAYSLAIWLRERFGPQSTKLCTITGVDIDSTAVAAARQGVYGRLSFRGRDDPRLCERYFEACPGGCFRLLEEVRAGVAFKVVNLLDPVYPPWMAADIILYRNVSIYFPPEVQRDIFTRLAACLTEDGALIVGVSETMHHDLGILSLARHDGLFYFRKGMPLPPAKGGAQLRPLPLGPPRPSVQLSLERGVTLPFKTGATHVQLASDLFATALGLARSEQYDKALAEIERVNPADSEEERIARLRASLLFSLGRFGEAEAVSTALLARNPLCLEACLMLGMIARQQGSDSCALQRFREAIYIDSASWLAHFCMAELFCAKGEEKRARAGYQSVLTILAKGAPRRPGQELFPLALNAEKFKVICRHKLSRLKGNG